MTETLKVALEEKDSQIIVKNLSEIAERISAFDELKKSALLIVAKDHFDEENITLARETRLKFMKTRTTTEKLCKELKIPFQANIDKIQAFSKKVAEECTSVEAHLKKQENKLAEWQAEQERLELEKNQKRLEERKKEMQELGIKPLPDAILLPMGDADYHTMVDMFVEAKENEKKLEQLKKEQADLIKANEEALQAFKKNKEGLLYVVEGSGPETDPETYTRTSLFDYKLQPRNIIRAISSMVTPSPLVGSEQDIKREIIHSICINAPFPDYIYDWVKEIDARLTAFKNGLIDEIDGDDY
jgi:hypothetical protein